MKESGFVSVFT